MRADAFLRNAKNSVLRPLHNARSCSSTRNPALPQSHCCCKHRKSSSQGSSGRAAGRVAGAQTYRRPLLSFYYHIASSSALIFESDKRTFLGAASNGTFLLPLQLRQRCLSLPYSPRKEERGAELAYYLYQQSSSDQPRVEPATSLEYLIPSGIRCATSHMRRRLFRYQVRHQPYAPSAVRSCPLANLE